MTTSHEPKRIQFKALLTPDEAIESLGIGRTTYFQLVKDGRLRTVTIGRSRRVPVDAISEFVDSLGTAPSAV